MSKVPIEARVVRAAEAALADHQYVSAIDVFVNMKLLAPSHLNDWRKGRVDCLERLIQGNLSKVSAAMREFRRWAQEKELRPSETSYKRATREGSADLQFSLSGEAGIERAYRTHYVSPALSNRKQENLAGKLNRPPQPVVFSILRDSECSECGAGIPRGSFLLLEAEQHLCPRCARIEDLLYLPAGDAALTRRASKYSGRTAVVVKFSRARKRYERQGILVEAAALRKAAQELGVDPIP